MVSLDPLLERAIAAITITAAIITILVYLPKIISFLQTPTTYLNPKKLLRDIYWIRRFWTPIVDSGEFVIVFPNREKKPSIPGIISYDVKSINSLIRELAGKFSSVDYQSITDMEFASEHKHQNLILVAGPVSNHLTFDLLQTNNLPYAFEQDGDELSATIVSQTDEGAPYVPDITQSSSGDIPEISMDYGIVTRVESPYDDDCILLNVAGGYGPGTLIGFELLTDPDALSRFCREGGAEFQAVYEVSVDRQGVVQSPDIVNIEPID